MPELGVGTSHTVLYCFVLSSTVQSTVIYSTVICSIVKYNAYLGKKELKRSRKSEYSATNAAFPAFINRFK